MWVFYIQPISFFRPYAIVFYNGIFQTTTKIPTVYKGEYEFFAVHRTFDGFHDVFVPDIWCAAGAGDTFQEALHEAAVKLACEINGMRKKGLCIPHPSTKAKVHKQGFASLNDLPDDVQCHAMRVVSVQADFKAIPSALSADVVEQLTAEAVANWNAL